MSIPKEPRQLMINLMYLVLIALLALNVSAEILNAFNLVNTGITNTNKILNTKNSSLVSAIQDKVSQNANDQNAQKVLADAQAVQKLTADFIGYIENMKKELIDYTGDTVYQHSQPHLKGEGDTEKPTTYFINHKHGQDLENEIQKVSDQYSNFLKTWGGNDSQLTLKVNTADADAAKLSWEDYNFYKVPTIAAVTILTKFENDARSSESSVLEYLATRVDAAKIKFDHMKAQVVAPTAYVKKGNEYTADIFIGASSKDANIKIFLGSFKPEVKNIGTPDDPEFDMIKGTDIPLTNPKEVTTADGIGKFAETAGGGSPTYQGVIQIPDPQQAGSYQFYPFQFHYETFEVGAAVVSPTAMNVLYIGVDNPVKISVPGYTSDKVTASGCGISHQQGENYVAKPVKPGKEDIVVSVKTDQGVKSYPTEFRIQRIPDPYAYCGNVKGGTMPINYFKAVSQIDARNPDFVFDLRYQVTGFEMDYVPKNGTIVSDVSKSNNYTSMMEEIKKRARAGDTIVFPSISVKMPDGTTRQLSLSFKLIG